MADLLLQFFYNRFIQPPVHARVEHILVTKRPVAYGVSAISGVSLRKPSANITTLATRSSTLATSPTPKSPTASTMVLVATTTSELDNQITVPTNRCRTCSSPAATSNSGGRRLTQRHRPATVRTLRWVDRRKSVDRRRGGRRRGKRAHAPNPSASCVFCL